MKHIFIFAILPFILQGLEMENELTEMKNAIDHLIEGQKQLVQDHEEQVTEMENAVAQLIKGYNQLEQGQKQLVQDHEEQVTEMENAVDQLIKSNNQLEQGHNQLEQDYEERVSKLEDLAKIGIKSNNQLEQVHNQLEQDYEERVSKLEDLAKIGILRSCAEYADFGLKSNGPFLIDPDGPLVGKAPFQVFCDFTSGATDVLHNAYNLTQVGQCSGEGCFEKYVTYISESTNEEVPATQIAALMQLSEYCVQGFYYECTLAPLLDGQANFAYWTDRHGEKNVYFTGENKGYHSCDCHFSSEGCFMEETRGNTCNCDASLPAPLVDTGLLTNMSALPVTKLAFGGLSYDIQKASFKLGNLQCYGKIQPEAASSCSALKLQGVTRSGYYEIKKPGYKHTTLVFCDMESDGYIDVPQIEQDDPTPLGTISAWVSKPAGTSNNQKEQLADGWVFCNNSLIEKGIWAGGRTPDLNSGHFLRGGSLSQQLVYQADQLQDHLHYDPGHTHSASSSSSASPHSHRFTEYYITGGGSTGYKYCAGYPSTCRDFDYRDTRTPNTKDATVSISTSTSVYASSTGIAGVTSSYRRGSETRPKNMKVSWIMKCW